MLHCERFERSANTYMNAALLLPVSTPPNSQWPPGSPFEPLHAGSLTLRDTSIIQPAVLEFERIDLNTLSQEKHYGEHVERFLKSEAVEPHGDDSIRLMDRWIEATWAQGQFGEFWLTKLPPVDGRHYWHL